VAKAPLAASCASTSRLTRDGIIRIDQAGERAGSGHEIDGRITR